MEEKVLQTIKKYNLIQNNDKIILAVSGGPDSIAMLNCLFNLKIKLEEKENLRFQIYVAHVNHMIREEAKSDETYVQELCDKLNIPFFSKSIDVKKIAHNNKMGIEEAGRIERYNFFNEVMEKTNGNKIAIAHNKNDKIETIIMHLLRGTGLNGLIGLEPIKNNKYIRPLLECSRQEIEEYCEKNNLNPKIDKTNFDNTYTRNKIRNIVIPYIKQEFNPNIVETLDRLSDLVKEEELYITKQVEKIYREICICESKSKIILNLKQFNYQDKVIKSKILLYTITKIFGDSKGIEKIHIEDLIKLCSNNIGNKYLMPNKNLKVLVKNGQIYFIDQRQVSVES